MGFLTTKVLGFASIGLLIALLAASSFGWLQTDRLGRANQVITTQGMTISAKSAEIVLLNQRITSDRSLIGERDRLIGLQNRAVLAMRDVAEADRVAYQGRIAAAERLAQTYETRAASIMARQASTTDELQRSREALRLIQEVIGATDPTAPAA